MADNPVLGFLSASTTGDGPHATVAKMLRLLGILTLVSFVVSLLNSVLLITLGTSYYAATGTTVAGPVLAAGAIFGIVISLVIMGLVLWWITFTLTAWNNHEARGSTHALVIGILATVFGCIGVLFGLLGGVFAATAFPIYMVLSLVGILISAGEAYCGIMILMNRSKATAGTGAVTVH